MPLVLKFTRTDSLFHLVFACPRPRRPLKRRRDEVCIEDVKPPHRTASGAETAEGPAVRRHSFSRLPTPPPFPDHVPSSRTNSTGPRLQRRSRMQALMRTRSSAPGEVLEESCSERPVLELLTHLETLCRDWDESELKVGRRLVRFHKLQDGPILKVSCEAIKQEEYRESDIVVSCIYREEAHNCFVTSVDIIYLLEKLVDDKFIVEEKNRIRRNLEGLKPTTISKHRHGFERFFQRIMDFPDPKPRNIEKDLKVFEWTLLDQALEKILSKYVSLARHSPFSTHVLVAVAIRLTGNPCCPFNSRTYFRFYLFGHHSRTHAVGIPFY